MRFHLMILHESAHQILNYERGNDIIVFHNYLCVRDLRIYASDLDGEIYHFRDRTGLECDCVLHRRDGSYGLIEVKLGGDHLISEGKENLLSKVRSRICVHIENYLQEPNSIEENQL
jgi:hypothetical protein